MDNMGRQLLFIHIPKTAGSSVNHTSVGQAVDKKVHAFKGGIDDAIRSLGAQDYFKFCFVRNPWGRFYSLYTYFANMGQDHVHYKYNSHIAPVVQRYDSFREFCCDFPNLRLVSANKSAPTSEPRDCAH